MDPENKSEPVLGIIRNHAINLTKNNYGASLMSLYLFTAGIKK
jgi:hypothetical protein